MCGLQKEYKEHYSVMIMDRTIEFVARLSYCYITNQHLPGREIDLIDEAFANVKLKLDIYPRGIDALQWETSQLKVELHALENKKEEACSMGRGGSPCQR